MSILFFNLLLLEQETQCNPSYMVEALKLHSKGVKYPKTPTDRFKPIVNLYGTSFLLSPKLLFEDRTTDIIHKAAEIICCINSIILNT